MKKLIVIVISLFFALSASQAQDAKKDLSELFPKKGENALGFDMATIIKFVGNSYSANGTFGFPANSIVEPSHRSFSLFPTVFWKYFLTDNLALRARFGLGINNTTIRDFVFDDVANLLDPLANSWLTSAQTVDVMRDRNTEFELGIGAEMRRTLWRVQGYAGAELFIAYNFHREFYTYGNAISKTNQKPTTSDFAGGTINPAVRVLEVRGGNTLTYGGGLFTGVDFFISKNVSLGGEFDLYLGGKYTSEEIGAGETWRADQVFVAERPLTPYRTGFNVNPAGFLNLHIYF
ncbi:MAG: hypothetical protein ACOXZH_01285 [Bacteroidales bacterium]|jgi:hypothetical protein|nr:hypothetical protein [Bacteroidales bacterium]